MEMITIENSEFKDVDIYVMEHIELNQDGNYIILNKDAALKLAAIITEQCEPPKPVERPILDWLNEIDDPIVRAQALANYEADLDKGTTKFISLSRALSDAFYWNNTPQGYDYWDNIKEKLESQGK